jgi:hypothetical protein
MPIGASSSPHVRDSGTIAAVPVVAVSPRFTTQECVSLWVPGQENPVDAYPCVSFLWAGTGPGRERRAEYPGCCPGGSSPSPYRRAGGNGCRFAGTHRFGTDRHDALCSQEHEAFGLDERSIPRRKLRGVSNGHVANGLDERRSPAFKRGVSTLAYWLPLALPTERFFRVGRRCTTPIGCGTTDNAASIRVALAASTGMARRGPTSAQRVSALGDL